MLQLDGDKVGNANPETTFDNNLTNFTTQYSIQVKHLYMKESWHINIWSNLNFDNLDFDPNYYWKECIVLREFTYPK